SSATAAGWSRAATPRLRSRSCGPSCGNAAAIGCFPPSNRRSRAAFVYSLDYACLRLRGRAGLRYRVRGGRKTRNVGANMITRRNVVAFLFLLPISLTLAQAPAGAADPTAREFLNGIYAAYKGNSDRVRGIPLTDEATIRRYFEPQLA